MRRAAILAVLLVVAPVAAAQAQDVPRAATGFSVRPLGDGRYELAFRDTRAGRDLRDRFTGQRVRVECVDTSLARAIGAPRPRGAVTRVSVPRGRPVIRLRAGRGLDLCLLRSPRGSVGIPLTAGGRRFLDAVGAVLAVYTTEARLTERAKELGRFPSPDEAARLFLGRARVLAAPSATPPRGRIGVFSDGARHAAVVVRSAGGRRMFLERDGELARTNVLGVARQVIDFRTATGVALPSGPRPDPGAPLPSTTDPGVTGERTEAESLIRFTEASRRRYALAPLGVACQAYERTAFGDIQPTTGIAPTDPPPPRPGEPLELRSRTRFALCVVGRRNGEPVARVAFDDLGRTILDEGIVLAGLERVLAAAGRDGGRYPAPDVLSRRFGGRVVALAGPGDTPADQRIGVWSDRARRLAIVGVTRAGRRVFISVDGQVVTTNANGAPDLPSLDRQNG